MKKWIFITFSIFNFSFSVLYASTLRVASFNIRYDNSSDTGARSWAERGSGLVKLLKRQNLDLMGLQEVLPNQRNYMTDKMPDWTFFGNHRNADCKSGEASLIAYRASRFDYIRGGTFWLSTTPDTPGTKSWDSSQSRICTWAILHDNVGGNDFCFANTHLDHTSQSAREEGVKLILSRLKEYAPDLPWILTGDFNSHENSDVAKFVRRTMKDAFFATATPPQGPWCSNVGFVYSPTKERPATDILANVSEAVRCGYDSEYGKRIDYIYVSNEVGVKDFTTVNEQRGETGLHFSDHFPVIATVLLSASGTIRFVGELEKGTNFASVTTSYSATVLDFCAQETARTTLTLYGEDGRRETREHILTHGDAESGEWQETFENLTQGCYYALTARLEVGDVAVESRRVFRAANETERFMVPTTTACRSDFRFLAESAVEEPNTDIVFQGIPWPCASPEELPDEPAKAGVAFLENGDKLEWVVWDGAAWQRTGHLLQYDTPCNILVSYQQPGSVVYRLCTDGDGWKKWEIENEKRNMESGEVKMENGDAASDEQLVRVEVAGCAEIAEMSGRTSDPRLIADANGKKYDDLGAALSAGASEPLTPLWKTCAMLSTDRIGSFLVSDASEWLTFGGGLNLLRRESADGVSRLYYGRADIADAATNRYLKAAAELGLSRLLTDASEVRIGDFAGPDALGRIGFEVGIDGEGVTSEKLANFLRVSESCTTSPEAWSVPSAESVVISNGRVSLAPPAAARTGFVRIHIPTDDE